jgi:hypothetical protein
MYPTPNQPSKAVVKRPVPFESDPDIRAKDGVMARSHYKAAKRQKELAKKKKQEEKQQRKLEKKNLQGEEGTETPVEEAQERPDGESGEE